MKGSKIKIYLDFKKLFGENNRIEKFRLVALTGILWKRLPFMILGSQFQQSKLPSLSRSDKQRKISLEESNELPTPTAQSSHSEKKGNLIKKFGTNLNQMFKTPRIGFMGMITPYIPPKNENNDGENEIKEVDSVKEEHKNEELEITNSENEKYIIVGEEITKIKLGDRTFQNIPLIQSYIQKYILVSLKYQTTIPFDKLTLKEKLELLEDNGLSQYSSIITSISENKTTKFNVSKMEWKFRGIKEKDIPFIMELINTQDIGSQLFSLLMCFSFIFKYQ
ncbi:hypothetical protein EHI8A_173020 [Entamoeba histolytica HM-1:IMSS-B]|uniref:Uncharacterized protein n=1 Tax=Entamoeba histolytica HM-1:IMSS-B TaxID=885319 RepID=M3TVM7_ENTH1|nr:hypothetical protein EHI8A_173020 [Entamoeba histolytica HM-1:IMSS-B]